MSAFFSIIKNDFHRLIAQKSRFLIYCILSMSAILAAIFFQNHSEKLGTIAVNSNQIELQSSDYIDIVNLTEEPPLSDLVLGKYDAFISLNSGNQYKIETIKGKDFEQKLVQLLNNPQAKLHDELAPRSVGANIIGFLMMFILMQGSSLMFLFSQDKEQGQLTRVATAPTSLTTYLLAQLSFAFIILLIPPIVMFLLINLFSPVLLGFSLRVFIGLIAFICLLSTTFALFLNSIIRNGDSANMLASSLIVITSILAGCFYPFEPNNLFAQKCMNFLPQKIILNVSTELENHAFLSRQYPYIIALITIMIYFFIIAKHKTKKQLTS